MQSDMDILLTNDDGIYSEGLWVLFQELASHYRVAVVAPDRERSAIGHAITLHEPLRKKRISLNGGCSGVAVTGTPADCVKLGILELLERPPRLVISGINPGANVGVNVNYSGTVAAAREAALFGVSAISISIDSRRPKYLNETAQFVIRLTRHVFDHGLAKGTFLNVNVPDFHPDKIAGVRISRHGTQFNGEYFEKRVDPRQRSYYWQGCDMQTQTEKHNLVKSASFQRDVDAVCLKNRYITITPVKCDTTDYFVLDQMKNWDFNPADGMDPAKKGNLR